MSVASQTNIEALLMTLPRSKTSQNNLSLTLDALSSSCCTKLSVQVLLVESVMIRSEILSAVLNDMNILKSRPVRKASIGIAAPDINDSRTPTSIITTSRMSA